MHAPWVGQPQLDFGAIWALVFWVMLCQTFTHVVRCFFSSCILFDSHFIGWIKTENTNWIISNLLHSNSVAEFTIELIYISNDIMYGRGRHHAYDICLSHTVYTKTALPSRTSPPTAEYRTIKRSPAFMSRTCSLEDWKKQDPRESYVSCKSNIKPLGKQYIHWYASCLSEPPLG